jgi:hypothetical protein
VRRSRVFMALLTAVCTTVHAQGSLAERRLAITKGTAPGKVLLEAPEAASAPAASAASGAARTAATAGTTAAAAGTPAAPARTGLFSKLPPPSGRPLAETRRFDAPELGIVVKPAVAASAPAKR